MTWCDYRMVGDCDGNDDFDTELTKVIVFVVDSVCVGGDNYGNDASGNDDGVNDDDCDDCESTSNKDVDDSNGSNGNYDDDNSFIVPFSLRTLSQLSS